MVSGAGDRGARKPPRKRPPPSIFINPRKRSSTQPATPAAMASPAAAAAQVVDPLKLHKLTVQLSPSLAGAESKKRPWSSISFNHKPNQTQPRRTSTITSEQDQCRLTIQDEAANGDVTGCKYKGRRNRYSPSYALVFGPAGTCTLKQIDAEYTFNLVSAPWESDAVQVAKDYTQLPLSPERQASASPARSEASAHEDDVFGHERNDGPDPSNPFDWRHYLHGTSFGHLSESKPASAAATPQALTPVKTPRTPNSAAMNSRKPVKGGGLAASPRSVQPSQKPTSKPAFGDDDETWTSTRDYGELIVEDDTPSLKLPKRHHLLTTPGGGPISLRVASTAASGEPSPAHKASKSKQRNPRQTELIDDSEGYGNNTDVDELELPPPAVKKAKKDAADTYKRPDRPRRESTWDASDVADFQAKLEQAMLEREDGGETDAAVKVPATQQADAKPPDSESESEEE